MKMIYLNQEHQIQNEELITSGRLISYVAWLVLIYKGITIEYMDMPQEQIILLKIIGGILFATNLTLLLGKIFQKTHFFSKIFTTLLIIHGFCWSGILLLEISHYHSLLNENLFTTILILMGTSSLISPYLSFWTFASYVYILSTTLISSIVLLNYPETRNIGYLGLIYTLYLILNVQKHEKYLKEIKEKEKINNHKRILLQTLVDSIPGYVSLMDQDLNYKVVSKKLAEKLGFKSNELMINQRIGFQGYKSELLDYIQDFNAKNEIVRSDKFLFSLNGENDKRWHLVILTRASQGDIVCISLDIHDQIVKDEELNVQRAMVVHSNQLAQLGEMIGSIAHEVNAPLAVIKLSVDLLKDSINDPEISSKNLLNQVDKLDKGIIRLEKIISGLKGKVREANQDPMTPLSLNCLLKDSYELVEHKLKELNIKFKEPELKEVLMVQGREVQLGQVFTNLLKNSIDAIYHHKNPWIQIEVSQDDNFCYIYFIDSGLGISKDIREKIMQPFFTTKGVGKGTGLGLAICSKIIKDHGGTLTIIDSHPNTCFEVKLPK